MRYVAIKRAAELTGYGEEAIRSKIARADWVEGCHYIKAPDGRVFIDLVEVERWITGESKPGATRSGSRSSGKVNAAGRL